MGKGFWTRNVAATLALFAVGYASAQDLNTESRDKLIDSISRVITERAYVPGVDFKKWPEVVGSMKESIEQAENLPSFVSRINRGFRTFGTSHIRLSINKKPETKPEVKPEGGGDVLIQDSQSASPQTAPQEVQSVRWDGPDTAIFSLKSFATGYDRKAVASLLSEAMKAQNIVIDLRNNGGGSTSNLQHLLSFFLPERAEIGTFVNRKLADEYKTATNRTETDPVEIAKWAPRHYRVLRNVSGVFRGHVVVLVNRRSASASEIVAQALREHLKAPIIGSRSAGAVLASIYINLDMDLRLQIPISDYVSKNFVRLEKNPIVPDFVVDGARGASAEDPALIKALEVVRGTNYWSNEFAWLVPSGLCCYRL